ncbi:c-type cytochrome [Effusibacillus pohliae]|uniref:c-type cytochrome n=1 Tax=Effusibacillus pohliae TaxID=232270 RepID=UPI0003805CF5|nr:cytochrome c [Effusibacillus pohliae]
MADDSRNPQDRDPVEKQDDYSTISGIKMKHTKIPKFLKATYAIAAAWAVYYALTATTVNDRSEANTPMEVTPEAGKEIFSTTCAGCHAVTHDRLVGPGLAGVKDRLGDQGLDQVLHNGRPQKGMPAPPSLGLNEDQIKAVKLYLETLK